jgi:hypothetical protein
VRRWFPVGLAALLAGCATAPRTGDGSPPWSSLTSPSAALTVALGEVCLPAMLDGAVLAERAEARYLQPVSPRSTGSPSATAAWRLGSWHSIYVMALPNGGCSVSLEAGDPDDLYAQAVGMLQARGGFSQGASLATPDGQAINTAWCTPDARRPLVVGLMRRTSGRRVALLANVFRAQDGRPSFCPAA